MTSTLWLVITIVGWFGTGVVLAAVLGRRGFDGASWFVMGIVLGPLAIPIAWNCIRRDEVLSPQVLATPPTAADATGIDVLVGFDGSPESRGAIREAVALFGGRLGRLTLATVVPFDDPPTTDRAARTALEAEAAELTELAPTIELVHGHPATALAAAARDGSYDLLVVGTTGTGRAHLFGSAAKELAHHSSVPVLLTGARAGASPSDPSAHALGT